MVFEQEKRKYELRPAIKLLKSGVWAATIYHCNKIKITNKKHVLKRKDLKTQLI